MTVATWLWGQKARVGPHPPVLAAIAVLAVEMGLILGHLQRPTLPVLAQQLDNAPVAEANRALLMLALRPDSQEIVEALVPDLGLG